MKKCLFFAFCSIVLLAACLSTKMSSSSNDLLLENVEALSRGEVGLWYKVSTGPCPTPSYKKWVRCNSEGNSKECLPSDC